MSFSQQDAPPKGWKKEWAISNQQCLPFVPTIPVNCQMFTLRGFRKASLMLLNLRKGFINQWMVLAAFSTCHWNSTNRVDWHTHDIWRSILLLAKCSFLSTSVILNIFLRKRRRESKLGKYLKQSQTYMFSNLKLTYILVYPTVISQIQRYKSTGAHKLKVNQFLNHHSLKGGMISRG